jgi:folylpolyglutamate synthase/dihydropteroate synthase
MAEMHPKQSIEAFWNDVTTPLASRFQLVPDTKPAILLDNADNLDALSNTFLGYRLLAYKQSFKSTSVIMGCYQDQFEDEAFIKQIRYFVKKCGISLALCPIQPTAGEYNKPSWDTQKIAHLAKAAKIKLKTYKNFSDAFTAVKHNHEDRNHLVIITGSQAIVTEYLKLQA